MSSGPAPHDGQVAILTGARGGIGSAITEHLLDAGFRVIATGTGDHARAIEDHPLVDYVHLDVRREKDWQAVVEHAIGLDERLTTLVNCAGIGARSTIETSSLEEWQQILDVNLTGAFLGIRAVQGPIRNVGGGAIVNIGSTAATSAASNPAYTASKWGLRGLTRTAAAELGPAGIRVNCVHPSVVRTSLNAASPPEHFASAAAMTALPTEVSRDDVAATVVFLVSVGAAAITAADVSVDGGYSGAGIVTARSSLRAAAMAGALGTLDP